VPKFEFRCKRRRKPGLRGLVATETMGKRTTRNTPPSSTHAL